MNQNMKPFFLAHGPKIKKANRVEPFNTVDLLSLFCDILEIDAPPNNGTFGNIAGMLVRKNPRADFVATMTVSKYPNKTV